jgi:hypothetical protein
MRDPSVKQLGFLGVLFAVGAIVLNLTFWLGLVFGILWLLKHFGVIH